MKFVFALLIVTGALSGCTAQQRVEWNQALRELNHSVQQEANAPIPNYLDNRTPQQQTWGLQNNQGSQPQTYYINTDSGVQRVRVQCWGSGNGRHCRQF